MALKKPNVTTPYNSFMSAYVTVESPFTNWSAHQIYIWGKHFPTVEHAYQYKKYEVTDPEWAEQIRNAISPYQAKKLAYKHHTDEESWDIIRVSVMLELLQAKLKQHEDVRNALRDTGTGAIAQIGGEDDTFWGTGEDGFGENVLGKLWMHLRDELNQQSK
jgi:N-glycosidase YbiA